MKKCWCIPPEQNAAFVAAMEDVLAVYSRPYNKAYPVVCMDEKPIQFFADFRKGFRSKRNGVSYEDYQYIRNGTACIFLFTEPLLGRVDTKPNNASFRQNFTHPALKRFDRRQPACTFSPCLHEISARKSAYYFSVNTP